MDTTRDTPRAGLAALALIITALLVALAAPVASQVPGKLRGRSSAGV